MRVPSYLHHKATGQARVRIHGRDFYLGKYGSPESRREYDRLVGEYLAGRAAPKPPPDLSVSELIERFWADAEKRSTPKERSRMSLPLRSLRERFGATQAAAFGVPELTELRDGWIGRGLSRVHINHRTGYVKRVWKWGSLMGLVPASAYHALALVAGLAEGAYGVTPSRRVRPVRREVFDLTLPHLSPVLRDLLTVQWLTGARPGEVCLMRGRDIDRHGKTPDGDGFHGVWVYVPERHKTERHGGRLIFLGPKAQAVLAPRLRDGYLFAPREAAEWFARENGRKVAGEYTDRYTAESLGLALRRACARAFPLPDHLRRRPCESRRGWAARLTEAQHAEAEAWRRDHDWHAHQVRHARATQLRALYSPDAARVVLGHKLPGVTGRYAQPDLALAARVMAEVG